ncbi:hypothetical protein ACFU98_46110 [Streptomyces sp. NPDC057575]|uniref:hypothetical protein n=1 Tax=unclassified Streptomyces TaxID=2593676 RepID=UPI0036BC880F
MLSHEDVVAQQDRLLAGDRGGTQDRVLADDRRLADLDPGALGVEHRAVPRDRGLGGGRGWPGG